MSISDAPITEMTPGVEGTRRAAPVAPLAVMVVLVLVLGLVGLAVVDNHGASNVRLRTTAVPLAADATAKAGSSKVTLDIKTDVVEGTKATHVEVTGAGAFDYSAREGRLDEHLSGATVPPGTPSDVSILITGSALYASGPAVSSKLPPGKTFLRTPLPPASVVPNANANPVDTLGILKNVSGPIVKVGKERIRGVDTEHYATTVDLAKTQSRSQGLANGSSQQPASQLAPIGLALNVAADVWLDKVGRVRRMRITFDLGAMFKTFAGGLFNGASAPRVTGTQVVTIELFDFGTPARVAAPRVDQVTDLPVRGSRPGFNFGLKTE